MKYETKMAIQNYTREVRGRVAHRIDSFFDKRGDLSDAVSIEVARFAAAEAADSVNCFSFINTESISLKEAKLFIDGASEARDDKVEKAVNHFRKRLSMCDKKKSEFMKSVDELVKKLNSGDFFHDYRISVLGYPNADVIADECSGTVSQTFRATVRGYSFLFVVDEMKVDLGLVSPKSYSDIINSVDSWSILGLGGYQVKFSFSGKCRYGNIFIEADPVNNCDAFHHVLVQALNLGEAPTVVISKC